MNINYIYIAAITLLLGCNKEPNLPIGGEFDGLISISTRATAKVDNFENGSTMRLNIFDEGTTKPYLDERFAGIYGDIMGIKDDEGVWGYSFDEGTTVSPQIGFISDPEATIDIFAISPYDDFEDITSVSFDQNTQKGFMYASYKDIPLSGTTLSADLHFEHMMSALNFKFTAKNNANNVTITALSFKVTDASGVAKNVLTESGAINFKTGEVTPDAPCSSFEIANIQKTLAIVYPDDGSDSYYYLELPIYIPPFEINSTDKLIISFKIDEVDIDEQVTLTGEDFGTDSNGKYGMEKGSRYSLNITIDNYLKLKGNITKETDWGVGGSTSTNI